PRTWLRCLSVVPLVLAMAPTFQAERPFLRISEDARQVAIIAPSTEAAAQQFAVNRNRPNRFTVDQWADADAVDPAQLIKPTEVVQTNHTNRFYCDGEGICSVRYNNGHDPPIDIAVVEKPSAGRAKLCIQHDLIIEAYAPAKLDCTGQAKPTTIIRAQTLALNGAAQVFLRQTQNATSNPAGDHLAARPGLEVRHALDGKLRPWHAHRVYSRSARNLAPYQRQ
ncbi:MAG: hypothetical protein AAFR27_13910, partial [Pseudomonadota bacterium]